MQLSRREHNLRSVFHVGQLFAFSFFLSFFTSLLRFFLRMCNFFPSCTALGYGLDDRWFESRQGLGIFLFTTVSRPPLGSTQLTIQWVPGALSLGVKRPGREADHSPPSSAEVKNAWSYTSTTPIRLRDVVLS